MLVEEYNFLPISSCHTNVLKAHVMFAKQNQTLSGDRTIFFDYVFTTLIDRVCVMRSVIEIVIT